MPNDDIIFDDLVRMAEEAIELLGNMGLDEFVRDRKTQLAILHLLTLIGEASRRSSPQFRLKHHDLPWPQMIGIRNVIVHEYDGVDLRIVHSVVTSYLPRLIQQIKNR